MPIHQRYTRPMRFFDAIMAMITDPRGTTEHLLNERNPPPFILGSIILILLTLFSPALIYQYRYNSAPSSPEFTRAFMVTLSVAFVFFVATEIVFLRMVGVMAPVIKIFAAIVYAAVPVVPIFLAYYAASYLTIGHFGIAYYLSTGRRAGGDWFLSFFPYFWGFANFCSILVFAGGLKSIGQMSFTSGILIAILSIGLIIFSLFVGVQVANALYPDTYTQVWRWLFRFGTVPS